MLTADSKIIVFGSAKRGIVKKISLLRLTWIYRVSCWPSSVLFPQVPAERGTRDRTNFASFSALQTKFSTTESALSVHSTTIQMHTCSVNPCICFFLCLRGWRYAKRTHRRTITWQNEIVVPLRVLLQYIYQGHLKHFTRANLMSALRLVHTNDVSALFAVQRLSGRKCLLAVKTPSVWTAQTLRCPNWQCLH